MSVHIVNQAFQELTVDAAIAVIVFAEYVFGTGATVGNMDVDVRMICGKFAGAGSLCRRTNA